MQLSWSDPRLSVASDSRQTARYRLLQSWYREQVLEADYGEYCAKVGSRPLGSLLAPPGRRGSARAQLPDRHRGPVRPRARRRRPGLRRRDRQGPAGAQHALEPADDLLDLRRAAGPRGPWSRRGARLPRPARGRGRGDGVRLAPGRRRPRRPLRLRRGRDHPARGRQPAPRRGRGEVHRAVQPHHLQQRRLPEGARVQRLVPPRDRATAARPGHQPALADQSAGRSLRPDTR